jgi:predicted transport protein
MNATKVKIGLVRELGVFDVTWETVQGGTVSEIVFVVTDEDYATKNEGFLGYILEQNGNGGKFRWKECSERYLLDCQAYRFTYDGKLYGTPIRNEEVIKTIGVTKWAILKRKMDAVKELYNAEADLQRFLQETKQNAPIKTSETVLVAQNSVKQKDNGESLKIPVSWEKKLEDNDSQVKLLVKDLMLSIVKEFSDLTTELSGDDFQLFRGQIGLGNRFAVLMLRKDGITIRLRANPRTLIDPQKWITEKTYKWYFNDGNGEEKEIKITEKEQIDYAVELLKQSYSLAK